MPQTLNQQRAFAFCHACFFDGDDRIKYARCIHERPKFRTDTINVTFILPLHCPRFVDKSSGERILF